LSAILTNLSSSSSKRKKSGIVIEKVHKLHFQADSFESQAWGKIDSSLIAYILFENSRLKTAMSRKLFIS
jgi:hypothetical protein